MNQSKCKYLRKLTNTNLITFLVNYYYICDKYVNKYKKYNTNTLYKAWRMITKSEDLLYIIITHARYIDIDIVSPIFRESYKLLNEKMLNRKHPKYIEIISKFEEKGVVENGKCIYNNLILFYLYVNLWVNLWVNNISYMCIYEMV